MIKRSELPASPRHVLIYDEDWDFLVEHFGAGGSKLGTSNALRAIIHSSVQHLKAKIELRREESPRDGGE